MFQRSPWLCRCPSAMSGAGKIAASQSQAQKATKEAEPTRKVSSCRLPSIDSRANWRNTLSLSTAGQNSFSRAHLYNRSRAWRPDEETKTKPLRCSASPWITDSLRTLSWEWKRTPISIRSTATRASPPLSLTRNKSLKQNRNPRPHRHPSGAAFPLDHSCTNWPIGGAANNCRKSVTRVWLVWPRRNRWQPDRRRDEPSRRQLSSFGRAHAERCDGTSMASLYPTPSFSARARTRLP